MSFASQDLRFAFRTLRNRPAFVLVVALTLGLGIGATTAVFTVINGVLLSPLGYEDSDELMMVWQKLRFEGVDEAPTSPANFADWRERNRTFEDMAAFNRRNVGLEIGGQITSVSGAVISPSFFELLGSSPAQGRTFSPDHQSGDPAEVVLSHGLFTRKFGADPNILGQSVLLGGEPYSVVGVMPPDFRFILDAELWMPLTFTQEDFVERNSIFLLVVGRLKDGIPMERAQEDMDTVSNALAEEYPANFGWDVKLEPLREMVVGDVRSTLLIRLAVVGLVLLIACANVANLQLARIIEREGELAIRQSLGASRWQLIRQMLVENLLLAGLGGAVGLLIAYLGLELLLKVEPGTIPQLSEVSIDARVLGFALLLTLVTGIVFGLAPIFHSVRVRLAGLMAEGGGRSGGSLSMTSLRSVLVTLEVALAVVILLAAGLTVRSFQRLQEVDPGFKPQQVIGGEIFFEGDRYPEAHQRLNFVEELLTRARALPSVQDVGAVTTMPLSGVELDLDFRIENRQPDPRNPTIAGVDAATPGYFPAIGINLLAGRAFSDRDREDSAPVAIINQALADFYFPDEDPLGLRIQISAGSQEYREIVGIVSNVKRYGLDTEPRREIYLPLKQFANEPLVNIVMRYDESADPQEIIGGFRRLVASVDDQQAVAAVRNIEELFFESVVQRRFNTWLVATSAVIALLLAVIGIYGILRYAVAQQTQEIGIRRALGAQARDILNLVLKQGLMLTTLGLLLGLLASPLVIRFMSSFFFGLETFDLPTFVGIPIIFLAVSFIACIFPAWRATRVDPMVALRSS